MRKIKKKALIGILGGACVIGGSIGGVLWFKNKDKKPEETIHIKLKKDLTAEINSEVQVQSFVSEENEVKILNLDEIITTKVLGEKTIILKYLDKDIEKEYSFKIKVVDTAKPKIEFKKEIKVTVGNKINLLSGVKATDNSLEEIEVKVEGDYDLNKIGKYNLKYVAVDSSNNKAEEDFVLVVQKGKTYNYAKLGAPTGEKENVSKTSKGFDIYTVNGITYVDDYLIANKTYALPSDYVPANTYKSAVGVTGQCATCIEKTAYKAWQDMQSDAAALGLNLWIQSGYRPYSLQQALYNRYVNADGKKAADTYSARAGHSEHQTGLCFDLNTITDSFANTAEGKWVNANAYKYGYIIRYPKGKESKTGYIYESWHIRYVGTDLAEKLYNNGDWITIEEYFGITSEYAD